MRHGLVFEEKHTHTNIEPERYCFNIQTSQRGLNVCTFGHCVSSQSSFDYISQAQRSSVSADGVCALDFVDVCVKMWSNSFLGESLTFFTTQQSVYVAVARFSFLDANSAFTTRTETSENWVFWK